MPDAPIATDLRLTSTHLRLMLALPEVKLGMGAQVKVYDLASITNSDTVQVVVTNYLDQLYKTIKS